MNCWKPFRIPSAKKLRSRTFNIYYRHKILGDKKMIGGIGPNELLIIFAVIVLLFGATKLPELAKSMGKSMGEFKKAQKESEIELKQFERSLEDTTVEEKETKIKKRAEELGIDTEGKTDDELLDAIQDTLSKREEVN